MPQNESSVTQDDVDKMFASFSQKFSDYSGFGETSPTNRCGYTRRESVLPTAITNSDYPECNHE